VIETLRAAGFSVRPYQTALPSFGIWGFALASRAEFEPPQAAPSGLRYLNDATMAAMFVIPSDMAPLEVEVNRLDNQALVRYYDAEWKHWN
jgi:spermidine synthase